MLHLGNEVVVFIFRSSIFFIANLLQVSTEMLTQDWTWQFKYVFFYLGTNFDFEQKFFISYFSRLQFYVTYISIDEWKYFFLNALHLKCNSCSEDLEIYQSIQDREFPPREKCKNLIICLVVLLFSDNAIHSFISCSKVPYFIMLLWVVFKVFFE